jgi:hypothetical protein
MDLATDYLEGRLTRSKLISTAVREFVGTRIIDIYGALTKQQDDNLTTGDNNQGGNVVTWLFSSAAKLGGFILSKIIEGTGWALIGLLKWCIQGLITLYTYDWAQTDKQLQDQIDSNNRQIITAIGQAIGTGSVYIVSIVIAGLATFKFPVIAGNVLLKLAEEGGEETRSQIMNIINATRNATSQNFVINCFLTARRMRLFGAKPIDKQREPWIIADQIEKQIDSVKDENFKAFLNGFKEGTEDAIFETLYVVAYGIEEAYRASKLANQRMKGKEKLIEIIPDRNNDDERLIIRGGSEEIKPVVMNALATNKVIRNRDVGQLVGMPLIDYVKANPYIRKLSITFRGKDRPPYRTENGRQVKIVNYNIPDVKIGLTWEEIKVACKPFNWGKYRCTANLSNGRQMAVYGASPAEAEDALRDMLKLSTAKIQTLSVTEEKDRDAKLRKDAIKVYPAFATLLVRQTDLTDPQYVDLEGKGYTSYSQRIELWHDSKPSDLEPLR